MMDVQAAINWLNEASDFLQIARKGLKPFHAVAASEKKLLAHQRDYLDIRLGQIVPAASEIVTLLEAQQVLLMAQPQNYVALVKALRLFFFEVQKTQERKREIIAADFENAMHPEGEFSGETLSFRMTSASDEMLASLLSKVARPA